MNTFLGFKTGEIITCLLLIVVGYFIAKMFSQKCNGFSVGIQALPSDGAKCTTKCKARLDSKYQYDCPKSESCYNLVEDDGKTKCVEPENLTGTSKNKYCISKKKIGDPCKENNECQTDICYKQKCSECESLPAKRPNNKCKNYDKKCKVTGKFGNHQCVTRK